MATRLSGIMVGAGVLCISALTSSTASAQAWVGDSNSLSLDLAYNFVTSGRLVETNGLSLDDADIQHHNLVLGIEYVTPLDGLAVDATLPMVFIEWDPNSGDNAPYAAHGPWDNGSLHVTPTDLKLRARYQIPIDYVAITPIVGMSIPVSNYATSGFASVGRHLLQGHFGLALGTTLAPFLPNLFMHAYYEFTLSQRFDATAETKEYDQNRSATGFQVGYIIIEGLEFHLAGDWMFSHGGLNFEDWADVSDDVRTYHDAILRETFLMLGGGGSYDILENLNVFAYGRFFVGGTNTRDTKMFGVGLGWTAF